MRFFYCGVPAVDCCGRRTEQSSHTRSVVQRAHPSAAEAYGCHKKWLIKQGYKPLQNREFYKEGEPIRMLSKPSRFGMSLRGGDKRTGDKKKICPQTGFAKGPRGKRFVPLQKVKGNKSSAFGIRG